MVELSNDKIYIYNYNKFDILVFHNYIKQILNLKYYIILLNLKNEIQIRIPYYDDNNDFILNYKINYYEIYSINSIKIIIMDEIIGNYIDIFHEKISRYLYRCELYYNNLNSRYLLYNFQSILLELEEIKNFYNDLSEELKFNYDILVLYSSVNYNVYIETIKKINVSQFIIDVIRYNNNMFYHLNNNFISELTIEKKKYNNTDYQNFIISGALISIYALRYMNLLYLTTNIEYSNYNDFILTKQQINIRYDHYNMIQLIKDYNNSTLYNNYCNFILKTINVHDNVLAYIPYIKLKNDYNIIINAVAYNGYSLRYASKSLRNNYIIVETAIKENGNALQYASVNLQNNQKLIKIVTFNIWLRFILKI